MRRSAAFGLERLADAVFPCDFLFEDIMISTVSSGRVLVTGFGPFGSERVNPSGLIAARLGGVVLPVAAEEAWIMTREEMKRRRARAVLALGVAVHGVMDKLLALLFIFGTNGILVKI